MVLSREQIVEMLRVYLPDRGSEAKTVDFIRTQINKAVEGLGTDKIRKKSATSSKGESRSLEETLPNIEVRVGAILSLERIARTHLSEHIRIMEILCTYIRENAPASEAPELPEAAMTGPGVAALTVGCDPLTRTRRSPM